MLSRNLDILVLILDCSGMRFSFYGIAESVNIERAIMAEKAFDDVLRENEVAENVVAYNEVAENVLA